MRLSHLRHSWQLALDYSLLMVSGAAAALIWANLDAQSYDRIAHSVHFVINDVAMVFFFGLAMKEIIEATAPGGVLSTRRQAALPVLAAAGGMAGPAVLYVSLSILFDMPGILRGWAIPCATDIAFSYLVARMIFGGGHPAIPFLLLLALADDAFGLVILATFYPAEQVRPQYFLPLVGLGCAIAWVFRRRRIRSFWPYVTVCGAASWLGFYTGGLHPALALVPILPFLPHAARDEGLFVDRRSQYDALTEFGRWWRVPVEFILFAFALANAGVPINNAGSTTWIVLIALLVGKPLGIATSTWVGQRLGLHRPTGLRWSDVLVLGTVAGIGFTVALFFTTAAFPPGPLLDQAKLGALLSAFAGMPAFAAARLLRVGRFAHQIPAHQSTIRPT